MAQVYRTLRVAPAGEGVLSVVIDAPPMTLIGPELPETGPATHENRSQPSSYDPPYGTAATISTVLARPFGSQKVAFSPTSLPVMAAPSGERGE